MRSRWLVNAFLLAGCTPHPAPTPISPPPVVRDAPTPDARPPVAKADDDGTARLLLERIGQQTLLMLAHDLPNRDPKANELLALGPCVRPTEAQRAAIAKQIATWDKDADGAEPLLFGCVDPGGTLVDVAYEHATPGVRRPDGIWRVLRVGRGGVSIVASHTGLPTSWWSEYADEVTLDTLALVDLDGDGNHDAIITTDRHEGGSSAHEVTFSTWLSRTNKLAEQPGRFGDTVELARGQIWEPGKPVVVQIDARDIERAPRRYRCIEPTGALDLCPAIDEARRVDRAVEIAGWFVGGDHEFGAAKTKLPDREQLVGLLDVLRTPAEARPAVLAAVPPTTPGMRAVIEIARALAPREFRKYGELLDPPRPPDPRPAELEALLGDTACPAASARARATAIARIAAWAAANDPAALVAHGVCEPGKRCKFARAGKPEVVSSCEVAGRGYYAVRWSYVLADQEMVARDGVFYLDAKTLVPIGAATAHGYATDCAACDGPPPQQFEPKFTRHGAALVALMHVRAQQPGDNGMHGHDFTWAVDGVATTEPANDDTKWYAFDEEDTIVMADVVRIGDRAWHWNGTWDKLPDLDVAFDATDVPKDPIAAWLWHESQRTNARAMLAELDADRWDDALARENVQRALAIIGADPAIIARVAELAAEMR